MSDVVSASDCCKIASTVAHRVISAIDDAITNSTNRGY